MDDLYLLTIDYSHETSNIYGVTPSKEVARAWLIAGQVSGGSAAVYYLSDKLTDKSLKPLTLNYLQD